MSKIKIVHNFFAIFELILIIFLSFASYLAQGVNTTKTVFIPKGGIGEIISYLGKVNPNINYPVDKYILFLFGKPQAGWIDIGKTYLSKGDFLYRLTKAKVATKGVIIYPGETTEFILKMLSKELNLSHEKLLEIYARKADLKDGLIIPETYSIPIGINEERLISYLLNVSKISHSKISMGIFKNYDTKRWKRYLIIASIIQKEAGNEEEMPLVSSVIYNRLKKGMRLQMDGALNYGKYSHTAITPQRIEEDDTRFNTYKYAGLPPYPICVVSKEAINAAIFPKKSDFLYFMRDKSSKNNGHVFTKTFKAHKKEINRQRRMK